MTQNKVNQLVINKVESLEVYEALKKKGLSDEEIYLLTPEGIQKALDEKASEWKDIKNIPDSVPRIEEGEIIDLLPSTTLNVAENDGTAFLTEPIGLVSSFTYTVNYNGIEYECVALDSVKEFGQNGMVILGNIGVMTGIDTGEPFIIAEIIDEELVANMGGFYVQIMSLDGSAEIVLSISGPEIIIHKVDERLLPDTSSYFAKGSNKGSMRHESSMIEDDTYTIGEYSFAEGFGAKVSGSYSHAEGYNTTASGVYGSHAEGFNTTASGQDSHAEGQNTVASGTDSHAEGGSTTARGSASHAEGQSTTAKAQGSHAEGFNTTADAIGSHAEGGNKTNASNNYSVLSDLTLTTTEYPDLTTNITIKGSLADGIQSHAEGTQTYAHGYSSHAEGFQTKALTGSCHAEGFGAKASGATSHAEGQNTTASGNYSHSEGFYTAASGDCSHTEGQSTVASGSASHAEGGQTTASGKYSHAEGGASISSLTLSATDFPFLTEDIKISGPIASGDYSHAEGNLTYTHGESSHAEGLFTVASGYGSHAEGELTIASGPMSHAEGSGTTASNHYSHAEGYQTIASEYQSHAEGYQTKALGQSSHTEGWITTASGGSAHAEGVNTSADGSASHAEGSDTTASGHYSHAEGYETTAQRAYQHVQGKYNIPDTEGNVAAQGKYAHIVGNGDNNTPSNAHTLDWDGNAWFSGNVYTGSTSGTNKDAGSKKLATEEFVTQEVGKINIPTLTKGADATATAQTLTPSTSTKKVSFTAMTDTTVSGHTVTDKNTTFTLDLSGFMIPSDLDKFSTPMVFKGTLGTGGTIAALPTASNSIGSSTVGHTYKVITDGTYASIAAKVGDVFTCSTDPAWVLIPSGDEPKGTVTNIATGTDLTGGPITSTGTISHANITRSDPAVGNALTPGYGGTFNVVESVTSSARGHVTAVQIRKVNMPAAQSLNKKTATVLTSATTISHSGGVATTNKIKATASGTAAGANGTANVITGYPNITNASFVNGVTNTTTTVVNGVSNTTAKALTGLGTASTIKAVTGYASPASANFVNGVTNNTTSVVNSVTNTTAKALTGLGTASTVSAVTGYTPTNASFVNGVTNNTTSVVNSVTSSTISVSNGILTIPKVTMLTGSSTTTVINKVSSTSGKALTGLGTPATSSVVTGYPNVTNASFVNSVSSGTTTVINKVSSTASKALTGLGTASTTDVVTGYPNVTNASFVNSVGKTTTSVVNSVSSTTSKALTGLGTPTTATALTGVKITTQPTIKLEFDATNGQVSVVTGVSAPSVTLNKSTDDVLTDETTLG